MALPGKANRKTNKQLAFGVLSVGQRKHAFGKPTDAYHVPGALYICFRPPKAPGTADVTG